MIETKTDEQRNSMKKCHQGKFGHIKCDRDAVEGDVINGSVYCVYHLPLHLRKTISEKDQEIERLNKELDLPNWAYQLSLKENRKLESKLKIASLEIERLTKILEGN